MRAVRVVEQHYLTYSLSGTHCTWLTKPCTSRNQKSFCKWESMSQVSVFMNNSLDKDSADYKQDTGMYWPIQCSETVNSCYQLCTKFPSYANTVSNWLNNTRTVKIERKIWTLRCTSWSRKIIQNKTIRYWLTSIFCKNLSEHLRTGTLDQDEVKNIIKMPSSMKFHIIDYKLRECDLDLSKWFIFSWFLVTFN